MFRRAGRSLWKTPYTSGCPHLYMCSEGGREHHGESKPLSEAQFWGSCGEQEPWCRPCCWCWPQIPEEFEQGVNWQAECIRMPSGQVSSSAVAWRAVCRKQILMTFTAGVKTRAQLSAHTRKPDPYLVNMFYIANWQRT